MRLRPAIYAAAIGCLASFGFLAAESWPVRPAAGWTTEAKITRVVDGDTLEVEIRRTVRVRLLDCWAPESRTTNAAEKVKGLASKAALQQLAPEGTTCRVFLPAGDAGDISDVFTLGRALGWVWIADQDKSLSQQQVEAGHARRSKGAN